MQLHTVEARACDPFEARGLSAGGSAFDIATATPNFTLAVYAEDGPGQRKLRQIGHLAIRALETEESPFRA